MAIRVALIEDHNLTRMGLKAALQHQPDMECIGESATGRGGLQLLQSQRPDVAILDIGLPDMDGIEVVRQLRASEGDDTTTPTKVLMLTMHDSEEAVLAAFAAGADSYCMKQTDLSDLIIAVRETYEGNSWIDPAIASVVLRQVRQASPTDAEMTKVSINPLEPEYAQIIETYPLTERELEILELIVAGGSNSDIADKLYITVGTVKTHVRNILNKLGANDRTQAAVRALRSGLVV